MYRYSEGWPACTPWPAHAASSILPPATRRSLWSLSANIPPLVPGNRSRFWKALLGFCTEYTNPWDSLLSLTFTSNLFSRGNNPLCHRCRKFFIFWEHDETFRTFLPKVQLLGVSRPKKRLNMPENILNMKKFWLILAWSENLPSLYIKYINDFWKTLIIFLNISASSNIFWEHCSRVPPLFAPMRVSFFLAAPS